MGRGRRPILVGAAVVAATFLLALAQVFEPSAATEPSASGDPAAGELVFERECASCHGVGAAGGVGPRLAGSRLTASDVAAAIEQGRGIMPAGLVTGEEHADVIAYVVSVS